MEGSSERKEIKFLFFGGARADCVGLMNKRKDKEIKFILLIR